MGGHRPPFDNPMSGAGPTHYATRTGAIALFESRFNSAAVYASRQNNTIA